MGGFFREMESREIMFFVPGHPCHSLLSHSNIVPIFGTGGLSYRIHAKPFIRWNCL